MRKRVFTGAATAVFAVVLIGPARAACPGDCNGDGHVAVNELVQGVGIALGNAEIVQCEELDQGTVDRMIDVSELVTSVNNALEGCPRPQIATIAGTGIPGYNDDGLNPLSANLYLPQDATYGPDGLLYFTDWNNHRVRRIKDGIIETVAGTGEIGAADNGPALYTQFNHPTSIEFDHEGRMLIAAWHNSLIKRLDLTTGEAITIAGTGGRSFGGDGGPGTAAILDLPSSVVVDSNSNIIISDQANYRLRILEPNGTINTMAGNGMPGYSGDGGPAEMAQLAAPKGQSAAPAGRIAIDDRNRIYIADTNNHVIRRIDEAGVIQTIVGTGVAGNAGDGGPALQAQLNTPSDVAVDKHGYIYIADTINHAVRVVNPDGTIHTLAGVLGERGFSGDGGPADAAKLDRPYGIGLAPNGTVYVADTHNQRIRAVTGAEVIVGPPPTPIPPPEIIPCTGVVGSICTYAGTGVNGFDADGIDRLHTALYWPFDMEFTPSGRQIVLDWNNHLVREILADGTFKTLIGTDFVGDGPPDLGDNSAPGSDPLTVALNHPTDIQEFPNGDLLVMAWHNHKLRQLSKDTNKVLVLAGAGAAFLGDGGPAKDSRVNQPPHGVLDPAGNLFLIDQRNQRIRVFYNLSGQRREAIVDTVLGTGVRGFNGDGVALETQVNFPAGGNPEPSGGIALDSNGVLYFADTFNNRIRRVVFSTTDFKVGQVTTIAGTGEKGYGGDGGPAIEAKLDFPGDIEIGPDGNLYFTDINNNRIRKIDLTTNTIETVAGNGQRGYGGDAGPATAATLNRPFGIAFDPEGDLFVSDSFNGRIRKIER